MANPYTFLFYILFKLLNPIVKEKDRIPFGIISIIGLLLIVHSAAFLIIMNSDNNHKILPQVNSYILGAIVTGLFYLINYFAYEKDDKYLKKVKKMANLKIWKKSITILFLILYLLAPIALYLIKHN